MSFENSIQGAVNKVKKIGKRNAHKVKNNSRLTNAPDPARMLKYMIEWDKITDANFETIKFTDRNFESLTMRLATMASLVEEKFPITQLLIGEILTDGHTSKLKKMTNNSPLKENLANILKSEKPNAVLVVNGEYIDISDHSDLPNSKIVLKPLWTTIAQYWLMYEKRSPFIAIEFLDRAKDDKYVTPSKFLNEAKALAFMKIGRMKQTQNRLEAALKIRVTALTLYRLYSLTNKGKYLTKLRKGYGRKMKEVIESELEK